MGKFNTNSKQIGFYKIKDECKSLKIECE